MVKNPFIIAIDGPAASGKGTLAKRVAEHYGMDYLDTGRLYRVVGQQLLEAVDDITAADDHQSDTAQKAVELAQKLSANLVMNVRGITTEEVGRAASIVSAIPAVREALLEFQKEFLRSPRGVVMDGRDIGTVVCPEADFKFYITADVEERAERRTKQLQSSDKHVTKAAVLQDLKDRDARDKRRQTAPLKPAEDAIHIDTTTLNMDDVFTQVVSVIESAA